MKNTMVLKDNVFKHDHKKWVIFGCFPKNLVETPRREDFFDSVISFTTQKPGLGAVEVQKDTRPIWYPG